MTTRNSPTRSPGRRPLTRVAALLVALGTAAAGLAGARPLAAAALPVAAAAAPAQNLVVNPGRETRTGANAGCWSLIGTGSHTVAASSSTGTVGAHTGTYGQRIDVSAYASGDHKWMGTQSTACAAKVTPGHTYAAITWYHATTAKLSVTVFVHAAAGWSYWTELTALPAKTAWTQAGGTTPVVPAGVDQLVFGVSIAGNGTVWTDDASLTDTTPAPTATPTPTPTPTATTAPGARNLVTNPGFETAPSAPGGAPACWERVGYGAGTVAFSSTSAADAHSGATAEQIAVSGYTSGDRKTLQLESTACAPAVVAGHQYDASLWYRATTSNIAMTLFRHTAAGWSYWTDLRTLTATTAWTNATVRTPVIPAGTDQVSFGVSVYGNGTLVTDDYGLTDADSTPAAPPGAATCVADAVTCAKGRWDVATYPAAVRAIHSVLLSNGRVLLIAGSGNDPMAFAAGTFRSTVWDPVARTFTDVPTPDDLFCSGHVQLADGNVLVVGGNAAYPTADGKVGYRGTKTSFVFDVAAGAYRRVNDTNAGHWYPSATELGNGDVLTLGGLNENSEGTVETEYFSAPQNRWLPHDQVKQTYAFWGLYPSMVLMQDGRLFYTGSHVFGNGLPGTGASVYDYPTGTITDVAGLRAKDQRDQSTSVLLPPAQAQKVVTLGGGNVNTNVDANRLTDLIDLSVANPAYVPGPDIPQGTTATGAHSGMSMTDPGVTPETGTQGKMYASAVLLPDRTVLETGGALHNRADPVYEASTYDPVANAFTPVAADPVARNYHSESFLLPDGRVASVGSNPGDGSFETRISLYSPGYLFKTGAPSVTAVASTTWAYGSVQRVTTSEPVVSAELIRPAAVTHSSDPNQRLVDVPLTANADGSYSLNLTSNPNLAPPGWYMLFVRDDQGIPSTARWVHVG